MRPRTGGSGIAPIGIAHFDGKIEQFENAARADDALQMSPKKLAKRCNGFNVTSKPQYMKTLPMSGVRPRPRARRRHMIATTAATMIVATTERLRLTELRQLHIGAEEIVRFCCGSAYSNSSRLKDFTTRWLR